MEAFAFDDDDVERLISREVVAQRLDCSERTVSNLVERVQFIPPILSGNMPRWRLRDVNASIAARATAAKKIEAAAKKSVQPQTRSRRGD
jgi:hypothetical protein